MQECDCGGVIFNGECVQCGLELDDDGMYDSSAASEENLYDIFQFIDDAEAELEEEAALGVNPRLEQSDIERIEARFEELLLDEETEHGGRYAGPGEWLPEDDLDEDPWTN